MNPTPLGDNHLELLPKNLSPSRAADFAQCPRLFYYKTICGVKTPPSEATIRGNLAHSAFERIFDHPAGERTPELAFSYAVAAWQELTCPDVSELDEVLAARALEDAVATLEIVPAGGDEEAALLETVKAVVFKWFDMERVTNFSPTGLELPDGEPLDGREVYLKSEIGGVPLHGFVDRVDRWTDADGKVYWSISDYKTGKLPQPRYADKYWIQLRIYALLLEEVFGVRASVLRLVFVASGNRDKGILTEEVTDATLKSTRIRMQQAWRQIQEAAKSQNWPTKKGPLCNWCFFQPGCSAWNPGAENIGVSDD